VRSVYRQGDLEVPAAEGHRLLQAMLAPQQLGHLLLPWQFSAAASASTGGVAGNGNTVIGMGLEAGIEMPWSASPMPKSVALLHTQ